MNCLFDILPPNKQTNKQTDKQTYRQTNKQVMLYKSVFSIITSDHAQTKELKMKGPKSEGHKNI